MKKHPTLTRAIVCLATIVLMATTSATRAAAPALNSRLEPRPLTPQEITEYKLTGYLKSAGLSTVPIGQPVYLDTLINNVITNTATDSVTWTLMNTPPLSAAALTNSPLGANVPTFKIADRPGKTSTAWKVADRRMLTPDVEGQYTVKVEITTANAIPANTNLTLVLTAAKYRGIDNCALCHSGGVLAPDKYTDWVQTKHAHAFEDAINGVSTDHFTKNCISCHAVGFDGNTNSNNGGFDDVAAQTGWVFPAVPASTNWDSMPAALRNVSNIQCENCHGPGSQHIYGSPTLGNPSLISVTMGAGDCAQCHDALTHHTKTAEWNISRHAVATRTPSGPTRAACARCHTASGFAAYADTLDGSDKWTGTNVAYTSYEAINCATCHDPHDPTNPHQLRAGSPVTLADGSSVATITNAGLGSLCMNCHQSRSGSYTNSLVGYPLGKPTYAGGSSSFGPHDNPAADMIEGVNGYTYGKDIPSSAHRFAVTNTCAGCHMQAVASTDPAFTKAGGHTFSMTYSNSSGVVVDKVDVCVQCHGPIEEFNFARKDHNGDGVIEGIQTEVQKLLNRLSTLFPNSTYQANPDKYVADGLVKSPSVKTNWPAKFLQGAWNFQLVNNDLSKGVHNAAYAVGLLKASIADLTGDGNNDGLPDAWQITYFGSANATNAGPNFSAAGDGVPNWLKYAMGLDPRVPGLTIPGGVVWANSDALGGSTNTIQIYTAAEVTFDTEVGTTYQIQSVGSLSAGWQNVGSPIPGTGNAVSYVTPTRSNAQQFYRVSHTP